MGMTWAFYPVDLGRTLGWPGIVTAMLLHGSWTHAALNADTTARESLDTHIAEWSEKGAR